MIPGVSGCLVPVGLVVWWSGGLAGHFVAHNLLQLELASDKFEFLYDDQ